MLVFAAFVPHTPLLIESIGKENRKKLKKTLQAMDKLKEGLARAAPETIVVISAHATTHAAAFSINLHDPYRADLSRFGDMGSERTYVPDLQLIDGLQRSLRRAGVPLTLDTDRTLDYGAGVPLLALFPATSDFEPAPSPRVVAITYSGLEPKEHAAFGRALRDAVGASNRRVAVIASGDLSHALNKKSPVEARPEGQVFDDAIIDAVSAMSLSKLLSLEPEFVQAAAECAYRPLLILFGLLDKIAVKPRVLAYEAPFGVGYLTAEFGIV